MPLSEHPVVICVLIRLIEQSGLATSTAYGIQSRVIGCSHEVRAVNRLFRWNVGRTAAPRHMASVSMVVEAEMRILPRNPLSGRHREV